MWQAVKKWLGSCDTYIGHLSKPITILAHRNDKKLWNETANVPNGVISCSVFQEIPTIHIIEGGDSNLFSFNIGEKTISCSFERNVNVYHNNCIVRRATPQNNTVENGSYGVILNYPIELVLVIPSNQTVRIKGFWQNEVFHITAISNYPIH